MELLVVFWVVHQHLNLCRNRSVCVRIITVWQKLGDKKTFIVIVSGASGNVHFCHEFCIIFGGTSCSSLSTSYISHDLSNFKKHSFTYATLWDKSHDEYIKPFMSHFLNKAPLTLSAPYRHHLVYALCRCSRCRRCVSFRGWLWMSCRFVGACGGPGPGPWSCPSRCRRCVSCRGWLWSGGTGACDEKRSLRCCRWLGNACPDAPCPVRGHRWCTTPGTASSLKQPTHKMFITDCAKFKMLFPCAKIWSCPLAHNKRLNKKTKEQHKKRRNSGRYLHFPPTDGLVWEQAAGSCRAGGCYWAAAGGGESAGDNLCSRWVYGPRGVRQEGFQTSSPERARGEKCWFTAVNNIRLWDRNVNLALWLGQKSLKENLRGAILHQNTKEQSVHVSALHFSIPRLKLSIFEQFWWFSRERTCWLNARKN